MIAPFWSHVALNCGDQAATEQFYTRWFGFARARVIPTPDFDVVFLRSGSVLLELFPAGTDPAAGPAGADGSHAAGTVRHIAFQTDDVDALLEQMGDQAAVTLGPAGFDAVIPGWRTAWIRDPDGVIVEVSQGYHDAGDAALDDALDDNGHDQHQPTTDHAREPA